MGLLTRFKFWARSTAPDPAYPRLSLGWTGRTASRVRVTADTAMMQATAFACRRYLTQSVGQLPVRIMLEARDGFPRPVRAHPVVNLLQWRANPELSPFQLKETLLGWALVHGNGIAEIERDARGQVVALWPIHPDRVDYRRDPETDALVYHISNGSLPPAKLEAQNVFHLRGFGDGPVGVGVVQHAAESIGWARATELFGASFFGEGLHFGGAILLQNRATPEAIKLMRAQLDDLHGGPSRSGKWFIGDNNAKIEKMTSAPNESQFVETMQHQVEEQCRWWGVPPQKVHHLLRMTFNNVEQLGIEVVVDAITPWAIRFEEEANFKLFGQNRAGYFVKLDLKGLLRGDFKSRMEGLQIMRRNGVITANDWAALEDMKQMKHYVICDKVVSCIAHILS